MKTLFIAAGDITWASSRMRCYWPAKHMQDTSVLGPGESYHDPESVEVFIWQKNVILDAVKGMKQARHYWDVCDPAWWWMPKESREIADSMTGVVASSQALADDFNAWYGESKAICIPDRLDLEHFNRVKEHTDTTPVKFIWYGIAANRIAVFAALANLERLTANGYAIELTICDDKPDEQWNFTDMFPVRYQRWSLESEVDTLLAHDVALLPPYPGAWGRVKSNNKHLTAWACGLPVTSGEYYSLMPNLMQADYRRASADVDLDEYRVELSARDWERILCA